jgi:hypothetical protein
MPAMTRTTKSATEFAKEALAAGRAALPEFSSKFSPKKFTQPQLFACLALRQFWRTDYRGTEVRLGEWSDLRRVLRFKGDRVPDFSTLIKAEGRLLKSHASLRCWITPSRGPANWAC